MLEIARRLLADLGLAVSDCSRIAYSEGPGSFTGLRVGMAAALGLAAGAGLPVVAVGSLEVLAYPWRLLGEPIVVLSGMRRGTVYAAAYAWNGGAFDAALPPASRAIEGLDEAICVLPGRRLLFAGDAVDSLAETIRSRLGERCVLLSSEPARAADLARLAEDRSRPEWIGRMIEGRTPRYLRDADARKPR